MASIKRIRASDETGNASQPTVTVLRSPGATSLTIDTVAGIYAGSEGFYASMGTPHTFTDPITGETLTVISEATAVDFRGHIDTGHIIIDEIAPGYADTNGSKVGDIVVIRPTTQWADNVSDVLAEAHDDDGSLKSYFRDQFSDFVEKSGAVWSQTSGLVGAMTAGYIWYQGKRYAANVIASHTFTASKDTYVDIDPTTGDATYVEAANNATEPAVTTDNVRIAKIVTNASAITSVTQSKYNSPLIVNSDNLRQTIGAGASNSTSQALTAGSYVTAKFDVIDFNDGNYDPATGMYTCPINGRYRVSVVVAVTSGPQAIMNVVAGGNIVGRSPRDVTYNDSISFSRTVTLKKGDTIYAQVYVTSSASLLSDASSRSISVELVGLT